MKQVCRCTWRTYQEEEEGSNKLANKGGDVSPDGDREALTHRP